MIAKANINWVGMTDNTIMQAIGAFIRHHRLEQNKTQEQLASEAGINRWTISKIEKGESVKLAILIQILRVLDLLHVLDAFEIKEQISPIEYAKLKEKKKKRARSSNTTQDDKEELEW
jgi:transcriptional regulator with XRE-family HTH domain